MANKKGISYINDSYSTTPETTIAAIQSFNKPIVLICGGKGKGGDYSKLVNAIPNSLVKSIILVGEMAEKIEGKIRNKSKFPKFKIQNLKFAPMKDVVATATREAEKGDIVLLSPGCASFDMFKNATDRGEQFKKEIKALK